MTPIKLTYALKPHLGEEWELRRTDQGFELRDANGQVAVIVPAADASHRIRFPSFWASVTFLEVRTPDDHPHCFKPEKETVTQVRAAVDEALGQNPDEAAAVLRKKAVRNLSIGLLCLVAGAAISIATFLHAVAQPGGGTYVVTTGLFGGAVWGIASGLYWYSKAGKIGRSVL
jgi:hypothetical protein